MIIEITNAERIVLSIAAKDKFSRIKERGGTVEKYEFYIKLIDKLKVNKRDSKQKLSRGD